MQPSASGTDSSAMSKYKCPHCGGSGPFSFDIEVEAWVNEKGRVETEPHKVYMLESPRDYELLFCGGCDREDIARNFLQQTTDEV
jgi:hypothetical protein